MMDSYFFFVTNCDLKSKSTVLCLPFFSAVYYNIVCIILHYLQKVQLIRCKVIEISYFSHASLRKI